MSVRNSKCNCQHERLLVPLRCCCAAWKWSVSAARLHYSECLLIVWLHL